MNRLTELKAQAYDLIAAREEVDRRLVATNQAILQEMERKQEPPLEPVDLPEQDIPAQLLK